MRNAHLTFALARAPNDAMGLPASRPGQASVSERDPDPRLSVMRSSRRRGFSLGASGRYSATYGLRWRTMTLSPISKDIRSSPTCSGPL